MKRTDKKLFALLMTLIMVVSLLPVGAFAADSHAYSDCESTNCKVLKSGPATCQDNGYVQYDCQDCGVRDFVSIPATGEHNMVNGTCTVCGMWETPAEEHVHSFTKKVISAEYATGENGIYYYSCECGEKGTETFNQDGSTGGGIVEEHPENPDCTHPNLFVTPNFEVCWECGYSKQYATECEHNYEVVKENPATCTDPGYVWEKCSICGNEKNGETPALGDAHNYEVVKEEHATCTDPGYVWEKCSICGNEKNGETPALGGTHNYEVVKEESATCAAPAYVWEKCSICGDEKNGESGTVSTTHGETRTDTVLPTCVKTGVTQEICKICDKVLSEEILPTNDEHVYLNGKCLLCGEDEISCAHENTRLDIIEASCVKEGSSTKICKDCGETVSEEVLPTNDAHAFLNGKCLLCGADEVVPCTHNYEVVKEQSPSCTEAGYVWEECTLCGNEKNHEGDAATGHTEGEAVKENEKAASCTADGSYEEVVYCSACNEELSRKTITVKATGHTEKVVPAVAATCETAGKTEGKVCSVCNEVLTAQEDVAKLGHKWDAGKVTKEPTATAKGEKLYTCLNDGTHTYTTEIAATGTTSNDGLDDVPKTGDATNIFMFGSMMIVALFGAIVTFFSAKKRNNH